MLVMLLPIFVAAAKLIYGYNFVAPLTDLNTDHVFHINIIAYLQQNRYVRLAIYTGLFTFFIIKYIDIASNPKTPPLVSRANTCL